MEFSRREFLKVSGSAFMTGALYGLGFNLIPIRSYADTLDIQHAKVTTTICPYCAVGCGLIVHADKTSGDIINTEGDPAHPINQGALCAKGAALYQLAVNSNRIQEVLYRAPFSDRWETKTWDWALERIAANVQKDRDAGFIAENEKGKRVNRTEAIAHIGSAALDNEECWVLQGMMRSLGLVYIEHQARI